jgi:hypothetical protein
MPGSPLRSDLEGYAVAARAADGCGAVEISFAVDDEIGVGLGAVEAGEAVQDGQLPLACAPRCPQHITTLAKTPAGAGS